MSGVWGFSFLLLFVGGQAGLSNYYCREGREPIVHLFEWKWPDVARECAWLASKGYCAVQVSPPQEHIILTTPVMRPWYERYQAVSYKLDSRSGSEQQFRDMVRVCNNHGVWIYVDAVINHMTGGGEGRGTAGSYWNGGGCNRDNYGGQSYPAVPYSQLDFNVPGDGNGATCGSNSMEVQNYNDARQVRNCRLGGVFTLRDLATHKEYVRNKLVGFLNQLINIGVAGFRVDAAKHMWTADLNAIYGRLTNLNSTWFPAGTRPYVYQEVTDLGGSQPIKASHYTFLGRVTEYRYGVELARHILHRQLKWLRNFGEAWGFIRGVDALVFIDNHDTQRALGSTWDIITYKNSEKYKMANAFMLAWNYGHPCIMSSYPFFDSHQGPPANASGATHDAVCQYLGGQWVCEHRWRQIFNMVRFHNVAIGTSVANWWDNGNNAIAFSRGNKAFIVINNESSSINRSFSTGLPAGQYCNVILCDGHRPPCTGEAGCAAITVNAQGSANIQVPANNNPMVAIHV